MHDKVVMSTTIRIDKRVRDRLKRLKLHSRESYNKVAERLLELSTDGGELIEQTMKSIVRGFEDVRAGRTLSMNEVKKRLTIE